LEAVFRWDVWGCEWQLVALVSGVGWESRSRSRMIHEMGPRRSRCRIEIHLGMQMEIWPSFGGEIRTVSTGEASDGLSRRRIQRGRRRMIDRRSSCDLREHFVFVQQHLLGGQAWVTRTLVLGLTVFRWSCGQQVVWRLVESQVRLGEHLIMAAFWTPGRRLMGLRAVPSKRVRPKRVVLKHV